MNIQRRLYKNIVKASMSDVKKWSYGWSRKKMFASSFQLYGFQSVPLADELDMSMLQGPTSDPRYPIPHSITVLSVPSSINKPIEDEQPGPED